MIALDPATSPLPKRLSINIRKMEVDDVAETYQAALIQNAIDQGLIERGDYAAGILGFNVTPEGAQYVNSKKERLHGFR